MQLLQLAIEYVLLMENMVVTIIHHVKMFNTSTNTWSSTIPDMNEKRRGCQAITVGSSIYVMGGWNRFDTTVSVEAFQIISMSSLYPMDYNYVTLKDGYCSPKSLENLCIDQIRRSLPDLDGKIPPNFPQDVVNVILESLVSHGALTSVQLEAFKHYELGQLTTVDERLSSSPESASESTFFRFKLGFKSKLERIYLTIKGKN